MTRRLVKSGEYGRVFALDYSEAMLRETARRVAEEKVSTDALTLCRADVAALPLTPGSIDAMHAGAAMHCWPSWRVWADPRGAEAGRRPLLCHHLLPGILRSRHAKADGRQLFRFFKDEAELEQLLIDAGFPAEGVTVRREGRGCAVIKAELVSDRRGGCRGRGDRVECENELVQESKSRNIVI